MISNDIKNVVMNFLLFRSVKEGGIVFLPRQSFYIHLRNGEKRYEKELGFTEDRYNKILKIKEIDSDLMVWGELEGEECRGIELGIHHDDLIVRDPRHVVGLFLFVCPFYFIYLCFKKYILRRKL